MGIYVIKKSESISAKILKMLVILMIVVSFVGGLILYKKHTTVKKKVEYVPKTNIADEAINIQSLYGKSNVEEMDLNGKTITFKIKEEKSLEPLMARYHNMITVVFNKDGYNHITINKKNISDIIQR